MKASQVFVVLVAFAVALLVGGMSPASADVPEAPEITGVVQDWRADPGYMVVGGVRYEFADSFVVLSEAGQPLPAELVEVGARVRFTGIGGTVDTVILLSDGTRQ